MADTISRFPTLSHWGAYGGAAGSPAASPSPMTRPRPRLFMPCPTWSIRRCGWRGPARASWLRHRGAPELRGVEGYVEVEWDVALRLVHEGAARAREHGPTAIFGGSYGWSSAGRLHHARTLTHRFLYAGGGCVDQAGNYSWGAAQFLLPHIIGTYAPVTGRVTDWNSVVGNTRLLIAFGGIALRNTQITSGGAGDHPTPGWLARARGRHADGDREPSRGDAPEALDAEWVPIRPNTDAALMLGMAHTLLSEGLHDADFVARCCNGFETYADYVLGRAGGRPARRNGRKASAACRRPPSAGWRARRPAAARC